jgi:hypothetical protein
VVREPKEGDWEKSFLVPLINRPQVCPVVALGSFLFRTQGFRQALPSDHSLFLSYLDHPLEAPTVDPLPHALSPSASKRSCKRPMSQRGFLLTQSDQQAARRLFSQVCPLNQSRSMATTPSGCFFKTYCSVHELIRHPNACFLVSCNRWALSSNTFEKYYLRPFDQLSKSSNIVSRMFLGSTKNETTSGVEAEASNVVVRSYHNNPFTCPLPPELEPKVSDPTINLTQVGNDRGPKLIWLLSCSIIYPPKEQ